MSLLRIRFPPGVPPSSRIMNFPDPDTTVRGVINTCVAVLKSRPHTGAERDSYLLLASNGPDSHWLDLDKKITDYGLSHKDTVILTRRYQTCCLFHSKDKRSSVLLDFMQPIKELMVYVARKLHLPYLQGLNLYVLSSRKSRALLTDVSLKDQGITPLSFFYVQGPKEPEEWLSSWRVSSVGLLRAGAHSNMDMDMNELLKIPLLTVANQEARQASMFRLDEKKMKWKKCHIVLDGAELYIFKDAKDVEATAQFVIPLSKCIIQRGEEIVRRKLTIIVRVPAGVAPGGAPTKPQGTNFVLSPRADGAEGELREWLTLLSAPASDGSPPLFPPEVFGKPVEVAVRNQDGSELPAVVTHCMAFLDREDVMRSEGLFRISGAANRIMQLRKVFNEGRAPPLRDAPVHAVAGLLKLYFREMIDKKADPLLTWAAFDALTTSQQIPDLHNRVQYLKYIIRNKLPPVNRAVLKELLLFLKRVSQYEEDNKMPLTNLATVFAPNILHQRGATGVDVLQNSTLVNPVVVTLCHYAEFIFLDGPCPIPADDNAFGIAEFDFEAVDPVLDLPLKQGVPVEIYLKAGPDDWWIGRQLGACGRFPGSYLKLMAEKDARKERSKLRIDTSLGNLREQKAEGEEEIASLIRSIEASKVALVSLQEAHAAQIASGFNEKLQQLLATHKHFMPTLKHYRAECSKNAAAMKASASLRTLFLNAMWRFFNQLSNDEKVSKRVKRKAVRQDSQALLLSTALRASVEENGRARTTAQDAREEIIKVVDDVLPMMED